MKFLALSAVILVIVAAVSGQGPVGGSSSVSPMVSPMSSGVSGGVGAQAMTTTTMQSGVMSGVLPGVMSSEGMGRMNTTTTTPKSSTQ